MRLQDVSREVVVEEQHALAVRERGRYGLCDVEPCEQSNWRRLTEIKRRYDPDNVFRHNANIEPAGR